jgi:beta-lactamase class A
MDLQTGEAITFGNEYAFSGTSINKVPILARLYADLEAPPDSILAANIANTMICSENTATNRLLAEIGNDDEFLGAEEVTRFMRQLGLENTFLTAPYTIDPNNPPVPPRPISLPQTEADQIKSEPDPSNQMTVDEMGWMLASMYQCGYESKGALIENFNNTYSPRECRQMLHVMSSNTVDALLKAGVPENTRVAHKHGWIPDTHGNAAVFFTPGGNYVLVMMLHQPEWLFFEESLPVIAEVSRTVYNYYNPTAPQQTIRDGFIPETADCNFAGSPLIQDLMRTAWDE